MKMRNHN